MLSNIPVREAGTDEASNEQFLRFRKLRLNFRRSSINGHDSTAMAGGWVANGDDEWNGWLVDGDDEWNGWLVDGGCGGGRSRSGQRLTYSNTPSRTISKSSQYDSSISGREDP